MTNFEFYNGDAEALHKALDAVCQQEGGDCDKCRLNKPNSRCAILFICAEHEEPPKPKKRRFYHELLSIAKSMMKYAENKIVKEKMEAR